MIEIEIGRAKRGRRAYSLDDVAVVPSRRTRDPEEVSLGWQIDAYHFDVPVLAAPMDSVMSPETAIAFGRLGGLPVLDLEGLWTRYEDPAPVLEEIASLPQEDATVRMREIYARDIRPELIVERVRAVREAGITVAGALSPLDGTVTIFLTELFAYPDSETEQTTEAEDVHRIVDDRIDLEQSIIDAVAFEHRHPDAGRIGGSGRHRD